MKHILLVATVVLGGFSLSGAYTASFFLTLNSPVAVESAKFAAKGALVCLLLSFISVSLWCVLGLASGARQ